MAKKPKPAAPAADQPYYLQRAHIKDFRSIRDAAVEFKPGLNIIIGPNGSGKTNLLRCIQNGLDILQPDFSSEVSLILAGRNHVEVAITERSSIDSDQLQAQESIFENKQSVIRSNINNSVYEGNSFFQTLFLSERNSPASKFYVARLATINYGIPNTYPFVDSQQSFYISTRAISYNSYKESLFSHSFSSSISHTFSKKFIHSNKQTLPSHKEIEFTLNEIEDFYKEKLLNSLKSFTLVKDIKISESYNIYDNSLQKEIIVKGIGLDFKVENDWLPFSALSSGTQRLFYIISEIIMAFLSKDSSGYLGNTDKILLLEEPELGIHPHQLHLLLNFLREQSEKHQLIITTHSPQVLDMLREDELDRITICELHKTKGTQFRKLKKTQLADAKRYMREVGFLSDYWRMGDLEAAK